MRDLTNKTTVNEPHFCMCLESGVCPGKACYYDYDYNCPHTKIQKAFYEEGREKDHINFQDEHGLKDE